MAASDAVIEGVSGAAGAIIALITTYPLLTISTVQALKHKKDELEKAQQQSLSAKLAQSKKELAELIRTGGWTALYAGLKPAILGTAVSQGVYFYFYSLLRQAAVRHVRRHRVRQSPSLLTAAPVDSKKEDIGLGLSLMVASAAGCANVLLTNPLWVVVTQMQASHGQRGRSKRPITAWRVAKDLYREKGVIGLWQGVLPSLVMVSNPTIQYMLYEWLVARAALLKRSSSKQQGGSKLRPLDIFLLSAVAKLGATLATYPLLLVKNRLQAMNRHTDHDARYSGVLHAILRIYQSEGALGFYKGINTKMAQTVLAAALLMMLKEQIYDATHAVLGDKQRV